MVRNPLPQFFKKFLFQNSNYYLEKDRSFRAYNRVNLAADDSTNFLIENPTGSEVQVFLRGLEYLTTQDIDVTVTKNVDFTGGTEISPKRLNIGGSKSSEVNVFSDVDPTGGTVEFEDVVRSAGSTPNDPAVDTGITDLILLSDEDTNLLVEVEDVSGNSSVVIVRGRWVEV